MQGAQEVVQADFGGHQVGQGGSGVSGVSGVSVAGAGHEAAQRGHAGLAGEGLEVGAAEAVGDVGEVGHVHVGGDRHVAKVDLQYLGPAFAVGDADLDFPVEAAGAAQRGVEVVGDVGGADDDDLAAGLEAVHQGEQLGDDAFLDLALDVGAVGGDRVDLVEEDDAGGIRLGFRENGP